LVDEPGNTGDRFRRIRVGVALPSGGAPDDDDRTAQLDAFCAALADALGVVVTPHGFAHYSELLDAMHAGDAELAWLPPVVALRAAARGRTLPIALPVRGGASTFWSALFAGPSSRLRTPADLVEARTAWVDRHSAAGYLVIRAELRAQGVDLARAIGPEAFLGSHDAVVHAVLAGAVDVGATFAYADTKSSPVSRAAWGNAQVRVLALAGPIPADVFAASIRMPARMIRSVQRALCSGKSPALRRATEELFSAEGFLEARAEHLDPLSRLLGHMVEDPRTNSVPPPR
jgi:phosphonate transport system substrate-binding protein